MIITVSSIKGGVGKSSLVILLANNLAARGHKILVIDMDLNNSLSLYYLSGVSGSKEKCEYQNILVALTQGGLEDNILDTRKPNIQIISSSLSLCNIRAIDIHVFKRKLESLLKEIPYDYVLIDTSPTYDNIVMSALLAADLIISPFTISEFNFNMSFFLMNQIREELPGQAEKTFLLYNSWTDSIKSEESLQMQVKSLYDRSFSNIMKVKLPKTPFLDRYTNLDEPLCRNSPKTGNARLFNAVDELCNQITGKIGEVSEF